jgi:peptidoglycan/LPS O-acetylase OafA/YrhL
MFVFGVIISRNFEYILKISEGKFLPWTVIYVGLQLVIGRFEINNIGLEYLSIVVFRGLLTVWIISFAYSYRTLSKSILNNVDISYGVYIYHMLIINSILELGYRGNWGLFVIVLVLSAIAGGLSRKFVELPALKLKKYSLRLA